MTTPLETLEAAKRLQAYIDRSQCRLSIDADLKAVVNHILAQPAPFRIDRPGRYEQRDGGVAAIEYQDRASLRWVGEDSNGITREWLTGGTGQRKELDLHRYIGPLDEPEPEPAPIAPEPVVDGGPAFPSSVGNGMSLRDYFAGIALGGLIACPAVRQAGHADYARDSYRYADAMLTEAARREKEPT